MRNHQKHFRFTYQKIVKIIPLVLLRQENLVLAPLVNQHQHLRYTLALIEDMEKGIPVQMSQMLPLHFVLQVDDLGIFLAVTQHKGAGVQALLEVDEAWQLLIKKEIGICTNIAKLKYT